MLTVSVITGKKINLNEKNSRNCFFNLPYIGTTRINLKKKADSLNNSESFAIKQLYHG